MDRLSNQKQLKELIDGIPGGIGIFDVFMDGRIELIYLNDGYYDLIGAKREDRIKYSGFSAIQVVPESKRKELSDKISKAAAGNGTFSITLSGQGIPEREKWLRLNAKLVEKNEEKLVFYVVYTDVTDYERTTKELEQAHAEIQIAADKCGILYWIYKVDEHQTVITKGKGYGYDTIIDNVPECFRGTGDIHLEEEEQYFELFDKMQSGVESCECYARIYNHILNIYQWQHISFTKLSKDRYVGSSVDVSEQKRAEQQYNNEIALRHELLKSSIFSYQINLSQNIVEEKTTKYPEPGGKVAPFPLTEENWNWGMNLFADKKTQKEFEAKFSTKALLKAWGEGVTTVSLPAYQLKLAVGTRWFTTMVTMMKRPGSGDIIAVTYTSDITQRELNGLITKQLFEKQYEAINIINCTNKTYSLIQFDYNKDVVNPQKSIAYTDGVCQFADRYVSEDECKYYRENAALSNIKSELDKNGVFSFNFHMKEVEGIKLLKRFTYYYLYELHECILTVAEDITEITQREQENVRKMQEALLRAEQATEAKTTFFANVSHDMRTPLNGVLGFTELGLESSSLEEKNECLNKIKSSGEFLLQLINDTLDMSKIESGSMILQPNFVSADATIKEIVNTVYRSAEEKGINLKVQIPEEIKGKNIFVDKMRLQQIFVNLLGNAIKFTNAGGEVVFSSQYLKKHEHGANFKISVADNGIGMKKEFIPYAFEAYSQQNSSPSIQMMGTGLGLAVVKKIVEMMKGHIAIESEEGKGCRFDVYLYIEVKQKNMDSVSPQEQLPDLTGRHILLCEDHPINRELAVRLLQKRGMEITCAENGKVGVDIFSKSKEGYFDAILMDIRMPEMDGLEATRAIRLLEREDAGRIPIIAMTANAFESDRKASEEAGMNRHISKPIVPTTLYLVLSEEMR